MAKVRVTGNAWDHSQKVIPAELQPRLFARPLGDRIAGSLLVGVESQATLNPTTGAFSVDVESGLDYRMFMDWLVPGQESEPPALRARAYAEWATFNAGGGGDIGALITSGLAGNIFAGLTPPPTSFSGTWIDLSDVTADGALVYGPGGN